MWPLTFESVDEILNGDHSKDHSVRSCCDLCCVPLDYLTFEYVDEISYPKV